jgi:hypothetical protein
MPYGMTAVMQVTARQVLRAPQNVSRREATSEPWPQDAGQGWRGDPAQHQVLTAQGLGSRSVIPPSLRLLV